MFASYYYYCRYTRVFRIFIVWIVRVQIDLAVYIILGTYSELVIHVVTNFLFALEIFYWRNLNKIFLTKFAVNGRIGES